MNGNAEQYNLLAKLQAKTLEAEGRIKQVANIVKRCYRSNNRSGPTTSFLTVPQSQFEDTEDKEEMDCWEKDEDNVQ